MTSNNTQALKLRECAAVKRCHAFPVLGGDYTVGQHCYNAVMLLLLLKPDASMDLVQAILKHDLGERWVGDIPCTATWDNGALEREYRNAEALAMKNNHMEMPMLGPVDRLWLHAIDKAELFCWAYDQLNLGNRAAAVMIERLREHFNRNRAVYPPEVITFIDQYEWTHTSTT